MEKIIKNSEEWIERNLKLLKTKEYRKKLEEANVKVVLKSDDDYPKSLLPYKEAPEFLFYKGNLPNPKKASIAIVGARACSNYGRKMAKDLARDLSNAGVQVISGMARGIDSCAAMGALEGRTPTFAVLGNGVDICYPQENFELYNEIIEKGGGIISEYPLGEAAIPWHFPARNRIISGLANKVLVVEAKDRSGSFITVEWALEQGKDILAVPGRVGDVLSTGCNRLIKGGAALVMSAKDILGDLYVDVCEDKVINIRKDLAHLYSVIEIEPKTIDEIVDETGIELSEVTSQLLQLQLLGLVEQPIENFYALKV